MAQQRSILKVCIAAIIAVRNCAALPLGPDGTSLEYKYVIVGGGTSGLVLANRLSENPNSE